MEVEDMDTVQSTRHKVFTVKVKDAADVRRLRDSRLNILRQHGL